MINDKPVEQRNETLRKELVALLSCSKQTVGSLSRAVRKSENDVLDHLSHIRMSEKLTIDPAQCAKCLYIFDGRIKLKKPSKCPKCRSTYIDEPMYFVEDR